MPTLLQAQGIATPKALRADPSHTIRPHWTKPLVLAVTFLSTGSFRIRTTYLLEIEQKNWKLIRLKSEGSEGRFGKLKK